jgi:hypothetical protein
MHLYYSRALLIDESLYQHMEESVSVVLMETE